MKRNLATQVHERKALNALIKCKQLEVLPSSAFPNTFTYSNHTVDTMLKMADIATFCGQLAEPAAHHTEHKDRNALPRYYELDKNCNDLLSCTPEDFKHYHWKEEIDCFFKAKTEMDPSLGLNGVFENISQPLHYHKTKADTLNAFKLSLHEQMNSQSTKLSIRQRTQHLESNAKSAEKLFNGLFSSCSGELNVLVIDFAFKPSPIILYQNCRPGDLEDEFHSVHNLKMLKKHTAHLLRNKRQNKTLSDILGYILKLEHGPKKGFVAHTIIILKGNKHQTYDSYITECTNQWHKITKGKGCTYNYNLSKEKYRNLGIGLISHTDIEKRKKLLTYINLLCKTDQYFVFKPLVGYRTMQISQVPKRRSSEA